MGKAAHAKHQTPRNEELHMPKKPNQVIIMMHECMYLSYHHYPTRSHSQAVDPIPSLLLVHFVASLSLTPERNTKCKPFHRKSTTVTRREKEKPKNSFCCMPLKNIVASMYQGAYSTQPLLAVFSSPCHDSFVMLFVIRREWYKPCVRSRKIESIWEVRWADPNITPRS